MNDALKQHLANMSEEDKANQIALMQQARKDKALQRQANKDILKTDYLDSGHWATLASEAGIRMPSNLDPASGKVIRKYCKKAGIELELFNQHYTSIAYFTKNNPLWSAYAVAGLILELAKAQK